MRVVAVRMEAIKAGHYDLIVGLAGGSAPDVAEGAAAISPYGGRVLNYVGMDTIAGFGLPKILIPTTAGNHWASSCIIADGASDASDGPMGVRSWNLFHQHCFYLFSHLRGQL